MSSSETASAARALPVAGALGFDGIGGQDAAIAGLRRALDHDHLPHTLLFAGPPGVGKASCAGVLAQALNCSRRGPRDACGECVSCSKIARGIHPDVHVLRPDPRIIRMAAVHDTIEAVGYAPHEARRRVVVLDQANAMRHDTQNAFLKTLEEPPGGAVIVLVTPAPQSLLPTVRSRCQSLRFAPLPVDVVRGLLVDRHGVAESEARLRAALAPGSLGGALALDLEDHGALLRVVVEAIRLAQVGGAGVVSAAESLAALGVGETASARAASTLRVGREVLRDLLVVAAGAPTAILLHQDHGEAWETWAGGLEVESVAGALEAINAGLEQLTTGIQPNIKMAFEKTLLAVGESLGALEPATAP